MRVVSPCCALSGRGFGLFFLAEGIDYEDAGFCFGSCRFGGVCTEVHGIKSGIKIPTRMIGSK